jgi:hypothetical protein
MDLQLLQEDTVSFRKKQFRKSLDDILNLLIQKNGETYLKIGDKASYSVSSYS